MSHGACPLARLGRRLGACVLVLALTVAPVAMADPASSQGDEAAARAHMHFERAEKLFDLGRFQEAQREFQSAYRVLPTPELLFNIGQCQRNLGDHEGARFSFRRYLIQVPDAPNREAVEELIAELEAKVADAQDARRHVRLTSSPTQVHSASAPVYTRWWFWTGIATVAAAGAVAYVAAGEGDSIPASDLGNIDFTR